ncbi:hypothetical protein PRIPAC_76755 [Pristionchus pacificus]|uniref:G protein-coupled receptor n=1 Tax=Pristionchus pacificus TaxID=54126 RepID=A0A2A6C4M8_PRIPA|nr:hypothetical protein PRIPAC_76755 [Pristionchus pacificus]|eukprot:PDM73067.1 G protein-coupled receptor [Pristionchus pacificus]
MNNSLVIIDYATKVSVVPAIISNVLLIIVSHRFSRNEIGTYRYIIILFSLCQILLNLFHFCINPKVLVLSGIFSIVSDSPYDSKVFFDDTSLLEWAHSQRHHNFPMSLSILGSAEASLLDECLSYSIFRPYNIGNFLSAQFMIQWTTVVLAVLFALIGATLSLGLTNDPNIEKVMKTEFDRKYGREVYTGWIVFQYKRRNGLHLPSVLLAIVFDSFSIAFIAVVLSLALLTFNYVSIAFALSPFTKNIHTRLLTTIGLQVVVSVLFVTLPSLLNMTLPIFGCSFPLLSDVTGLLNGLDPSLEAIVIIMLSKSYRRGVVTLFSRDHRRDTIQSPFLVTVAKTSF